MIFPENATVHPHDVAPSVLEEARARGEDFVVLPPPRHGEFVRQIQRERAAEKFEPWLTQPGWQVAVGTRTPRIFRARQALARIFRR